MVDARDDAQYLRVMPGWLVVFEGLDGAGKSTQVKALTARLDAAGREWVATREPTDGPWGKKIRESAQTARMAPQEELDAFVADRRQHVDELIAPSLAADKVVIVDRYYFSSVAYQGARGLDTDAVFAANAFAPEPDLLFIFDLDPAVGLARVASRGEADLFEKEDEQRRVREIFAGMSLPPVDGRERLHRIDANQAISVIEESIWAAVDALVSKESQDS